MPRIRIERDQRVPLLLSEDERELILEKATFSKELRKDILLTESVVEGLIAHITLPQLSELIDAMIAVSERCKYKSVKKKWSILIDRAVYLLGKYTDQDEPDSITLMEAMLQSLPPELEQDLRNELDTRQLKTPMEIEEVIANCVERFNQRQVANVGGLSPKQIHELICADWNNSKSPIRFNRELKLKELAGADLLLNARAILALLDEQGGKTKTTATGNLSRRFVADAMERIVFKDCRLESIRKYNKVINETDCFSEIHITRLLLDMSGFIQKRKDFFHLTRKGKSMIKEDQAGELYAQLFITMFTKFNLSYLDRCPDIQSIQSTVAYSLYRLSECAQNWTDAENLYPQIVLPAVQLEIEEGLSPYFHPHWHLETRLLTQLECFGLLETRKKDKLNREYKKFALYDKFLQFSID